MRHSTSIELGDVRIVGATLLAEHPHPALRFQPLLLGGIISLFVGDIGAAAAALAEAQAACVPIPAHEYVDLPVESDPRTLCDTFVAWATCLRSDGAAGLALGEDVLARQDNSLGRATIATTGEHLYGPEVLRMEGRVRAARGDAPDDVDACFRRAAEVARAGRSRLYEQRAEADLARRV